MSNLEQLEQTKSDVLEALRTVVQFCGITHTLPSETEVFLRIENFVVEAEKLSAQTLLLVNLTPPPGMKVTINETAKTENSQALSHAAGFRIMVDHILANVEAFYHASSVESKSVHAETLAADVVTLRWRWDSIWALYNLTRTKVVESTGWPLPGEPAWVARIEAKLDLLLAKK